MKIITNNSLKRFYAKLQNVFLVRIYDLTITTAISAGGQVTLPCYYKVR